MIRVDFSDVMYVEDRFARFGRGYGRIVDGYLHGEGARRVKRSIPGFIRPSGRTWKGKAPSIAGDAGAGERNLEQDNEPLEVVIAARGRHGYLYFPDDGTNTRRHVGNRRFMLRGAEAAAPEIAEEIEAALAAALE